MFQVTFAGARLTTGQPPAPNRQLSVVGYQLSVLVCGRLGLEPPPKFHLRNLDNSKELPLGCDPDQGPVGLASAPGNES